MQTDPLAGNRRASILLKVARQTRTPTRDPVERVCTIVEGKRVHTTRQRLVKRDDGA